MVLGLENVPFLMPFQVYFRLKQEPAVLAVEQVIIQLVEKFPVHLVPFSTLLPRCRLTTNFGEGLMVMTHFN